MNEVIPQRKRATEAGRRVSRPCLTGMIGLALILRLPAVGRAHGAREGGRLPAIGPAPEFALTTHDGRPLALRELRGRVVVVTFIYASCADTCPILTAKLAGIQRRVGSALGSIFFVGVTVDPERDTPGGLRRYAEIHGVNPAGWAFVTGTPAEIRAVARQYGVYHRKQPEGDVNDILDLSKVEAGRMELELSPFDLPSALESAVMLVRERAGRHGIALELGMDERLGEFAGDERKVRQVLLNLLSNAVKFTPEGGRVEVRPWPTS